MGNDRQYKLDTMGRKRQAKLGDWEGGVNLGGLGEGQKSMIKCIVRRSRTNFRIIFLMYTAIQSPHGIPLP